MEPVKLRKLQQSMIWLAALIALYVMAEGEGQSLCIFSAVGVSWCPGCGLGHSIHHALHFRLAASADAHWLGMPATVAIVYNIVKPFITKTTYYGFQSNAYDASGNSAG